MRLHKVMGSSYAIASKGKTVITACRRSYVSQELANRITSTEAVCREAVKLHLPNGSRHPEAMSQQSRDRKESFNPWLILGGASTELISGANALRSDSHNRKKRLL